MNRGLALAHGDYVMLLCADDHYHPKAIELLVRARAASGADVVGGMINFHRADGSLMRPFGRLEFGPRSLVWMCMWLETLLIPTAVLDDLGAFDTRFHVAADTDLGARLYASGYSYYEVPIAVLAMRAGAASGNHDVVTVDHQRLVAERFPEVPAEWTRMVGDVTNFKKENYDAAIRACADHPAFVEAIIAHGYGKRGGYALDQPPPAVVKRDIRLSVILDGAAGRPLRVADLSPYLAIGDVTVEVICTLDDTAPDDGLRAAATEDERIVLLRAPLALTRGARLNRAVARMRGDFVYFADPAAPPVAGGLARLVAEGDRSYGNIVRAMAQDAPAALGPPKNRNHYNFLVQNLPSLLDRSD